MLSILIPSYNHARYVEETIASARRINVPGKRIVIIDDASTDGSADLIAAHLKREGSDGIEFIRKPVNRGAIDSVITFLAQCQTEYVYFMASDDVAVPEGIEALVALLESRPGLQFAIGGGLNVFPDGSSTPIYGPRHERLFRLGHDQMLESLFLDDPGPILCQSSVFRLRAIRAVGGFDPEQIADDYAIFARLLNAYGTRDVDFAFRPDLDGVRYRHHDSNSYRNLPRTALFCRQVIDAMAPSRIRARAVGYKIAFFALIALKRRDKGGLADLVRMPRASEWPWFAVGLFVHALKRLRSR